MTDFEARRKREKENKRKAWWPFFGFIILVIFGAFSWFASPEVMPVIEGIRGFTLPEGNAGRMVVAVLVFIALFAVGMTIMALLSGGPPSDPRDIRTPTKQMLKEVRKSKRRGSKY